MKLFVYGIFLGEMQRNAYGMSNPHYATVPDYVTIGGIIVEAVKVDKKFGCALTGLIVDVDPQYWEMLDRLESGYTREIVETTDREKVFMYVGR